MRVDKIAFISYRFPRLLIMLWLGAFILFGYLALQLPDRLRDHGLVPEGANQHVSRILAEDFHIPAEPLVLVFEAKHPLEDANFIDEIGQVLHEAAKLEGISRIIPPRSIDPDTGTAYALLDYTQPSYELKPVIDQLRGQLKEHETMMIRLTGKPVVQMDVNESSKHDLTNAELWGMPVAALILWAAFRRLVYALIPIITGAVSVIIGMGITAAIGEHIELSNFVLNVIPMVGLALSIDFALMIVSRFREEMQTGCDQAERAIGLVMQTAGKAVLWSSCCVLCSLAAVMLIPMPMFVSVAAAAITVLAVSAAAACTLVPALLSVLPLPIASTPGRRSSGIDDTSIWHRWARFVMRRPASMGIAALCLLAVCLAPAAQLQMAVPDASSLTSDSESREAYEIWQRHEKLENRSLVYLIASSRSGEWSQEDWSEAYAIAEKLAQDPNVLLVDSIFTVTGLDAKQIPRLLQQEGSQELYRQLLSTYMRNGRMLYRVVIDSEPASIRSMEWVRSWEQPGHASPLPYELGGEAKHQQEVHDQIYDHMKPVILFIILTNYCFLFAAFRSVLIPLKTIAMNLLSLGASFGILTWIFQEGRFGVEAGPVAVMIPVFIFGLVFGISMDYGVFLVSRIHEAYQRSGNNEQAVQEGLASTGRIITMAGAIMIAVTLPFAYGEVAGVKQLGAGIAAAIFIDATIIRMIIVPVFMKWFGKWNWWAPRRLR